MFIVIAFPGEACKRAGLEHHLNGKDDIMFTVGRRIVFKAVKQALGLDRSAENKILLVREWRHMQQRFM